ncbi:dnaJ homolog subfamily C member 17-like isoform X2 [Phoenix dactylifera]|uniref:DnaJ homolog subfamily C member 17-like isoform X2 n=1 Tax=Phoenix dactylifera TaxID=42345 RepID=A0A8B8ZX04_PHODC|nr:dnaJ homolog subfamily C member 17-like isoform X2 [Phoenix dactylifera]
MAGERDSGGAEEDDVDHYAVLGLPSGEEGASLTLKQIEKAYRDQSGLRHPDKRPDEPNATADFGRLRSSFELLKDEPKREFDARLRARRDLALRHSTLSAERRKLAADLDERERAAAAGGKEEVLDPAEQAKRREKKVATELKREFEQFQARMAAEKAAPTSTSGMRRKRRMEGWQHWIRRGF